MVTNRKYKSEALEAIHSSVTGMYRAGTVTKATLREFDKSCLVAPAPMGPKRIKRIRESQHVSQPVFARYLNTSESTVEKWESGAKRPSGMALKLLDIVEKHGLKMLA
ncbi:MAG TPA: DNA-binding transcriptional regulator [Terracidiphilus sp.]|nr:DNA-binding transcriptional regulator [Terracidiphilus sp.]